MLAAHGAARAGRVIACAIALAYASHTLLDWLGTDSSPPIGIMALWPFSRDYYESHLARLHGDLAPLLAAGVLDAQSARARRELLILGPARALVVAAGAVARSAEAVLSAA